MKYMVIDISNLLHRVFAAHQKDSGSEAIGLATHTALLSIKKFYQKFKPDKIVACFDHTSWRKKYTQSEECVSKKLYKGNRRQNMTPAQKEQFAQLMDIIEEFRVLLDKHTSIITMQSEDLEADDLIAGIIQVAPLHFDFPVEFVVISGDKDFIQLLKHPSVEIYDPMTGKPRTLADWDEDANYFMFEKCIRGDTGDNVQSAYPGVRRTRIRRAYNDAFERTNLMNHIWRTPDDREVRVGDLFKENELLMDLEKQPDDIQKKIVQTVLHGLENPGSYSHFHFIGFCGKHDLKRVSEQAESFTKILSM